MKTTTISIEKFVCEKCGETIEPEGGKIFQGNVYMVDDSITDRGGLIGFGNIFDKTFKDVEEQVFCNDCIRKLLYL